jgi:hypothetical protein
MRAAWLLAAGALAACSSTPGADVVPEARTAQTEQRIIRGTPSDASQDAVVLLTYVPAGQTEPFGECTATLIASNLILTARHCVAQTADTGFICDEKGVGSSGGAVMGNHKADALYVYTGTSRPIGDAASTSKAKARGTQIVDDGGKNLCNHDIALVVLDRAVEGAPIAPVRLDTPPVEGATVTAVGWGLTQSSSLPGLRQQRTGIKINHVGPFVDTTSLMAVPDKEFEVGESICQGDSGGPALDSQTGAVIGVVSRGGNGTNDPRNPAGSCLGTNTQNYYTQTTAFKDLILQAFEAAGAEPWIEGQPDPRLAKFGEACESNDACRSNICLTSKKICTQTCDATNECPDGYDCAAQAGSAEKICTVKQPPPPATQTTTSGCGIGAREPEHRIANLLLAAALGIACGRRRERR